MSTLKNNNQTEQIQWFSTKRDNLGSVPGTHIVETENQLSQLSSNFQKHTWTAFPPLQQIDKCRHKIIK